MENGGVRNIVLIALVVVLSFVIGSLSADGWKDALLPVIMIAGAFIMLYLGKNSKYLIFYLPPVISLAKIHTGWMDISCLISDAVFAYWIVMRLMGYVRLKWVGNLLIDSLVLVFFLYMCLSFYRNPVAVAALGLDSDMMGGADYVMCLVGVMGYIAISIIPFSALELCKIIRNVVYLNLGVAVIKVFTGASAYSNDGGMGEAMQTSRFTLFSTLGEHVFGLIYGLNPLRKLWSSPTKIFILLLCLAAVFLSGWRGTIIAFTLGIFVLAFLKRELSFVICLGAACYAGLLFLSSEHALNELPFGVQRSLCAIPGIHVSKRVELEAQGSSDWRKEMWEWALDPRTRYIKDYVWGDGPGISRSQAERLEIAVMRGDDSSGDNIHFAERGVWHSGWITFLHRYGIVGLVLAVTYHLLYSLFSILSCLRYRSTEYFPYLAIYCRFAIPVSVMHYLGTGMPTGLFATLPTIALYKQLYIRARELGRDDSFFRSEPYTPLMIQDIREKEAGQNPYVHA